MNMDTEPKESLRECDEGTLMDIEVIPSSGKSMVAGYDPWRRRVVVKIKERAEGGRANRELIKLFSSKFDSDVIIVKGSKSKMKTILIKDTNKEEVSRTMWGGGKK